MINVFAYAEPILLEDGDSEAGWAEYVSLQYSIKQGDLSYGLSQSVLQQKSPETLAKEDTERPVKRQLDPNFE